MRLLRAFDVCVVAAFAITVRDLIIADGLDG
jgi:hypothetical protein